MCCHGDAWGHVDKPRLFDSLNVQHIFSNMHGHCSCNLFPSRPLLVIRDMLKWSFVAGVCAHWWFFPFRPGRHFSSSAARCLCLRCWNESEVLLPLAAITLEQTLQRTVVCSRLDSGKPNQFQTAEETGKKTIFLKKKFAWFYVPPQKAFSSPGTTLKSDVKEKTFCRKVSVRAHVYEESRLSQPLQLNA